MNIKTARKKKSKKFEYVITFLIIIYLVITYYTHNSHH